MDSKNKVSSSQYAVFQCQYNHRNHTYVRMDERYTPITYLRTYLLCSVGCECSSESQDYIRLTALGINFL
jgi:hypothetical protein